jgi:hypothetical protein
MEFSFSVLSTLIYYDVPQLVLIEDRVDTYYLCVLGANESEVHEYGCVPISKRRYEDVRNGDLDVRAALISAESHDWLLLKTDNISSGIGQVEKRSGQLDELFLPEQGLVVVDSSADEVVKVARFRENLVAEITVSPADSRENAIASRVLSKLLWEFQNLVRRAAKAVDRIAPRKSPIDVESYQLDVLAFNAGSFQIRFEAHSHLDLLGDSQLERALTLVENTMRRANAPDDLASYLEDYKGHYVASLIKFLQIAGASNTYVRLDWAKPASSSANTSLISALAIAPALEKLTSKEEMSRVDITILGRLKKVDVDTGAWRIKNDSTGEEYSGKAFKGTEASLSGLKTDEIYEVECVEAIEEQTFTEKEVVALYAVRFTPAGVALSGSHLPLSNK